MLWIFLTLAAAPLQVARNAMQRGLVGEAGPWGATLVRFLFGLPFSLAIFGVVAFLTPGAAPHGSPWFWTWASVGATSQVLGMAALLAAMQRCGFGVATVLQLSALPVGALIGWLAFGDALSVVAWAGVALASVSLALVSWPWRAEPSFTGSALGLAAGLGFAMAFNSYRQATIFEVQRNRTVIDFAGRNVVVPMYELGEWRLPHGFSILVSLLQLHRDPTVYPDPERFDPQRFLDDKPNTYAWVPFGGGTRRCVGAAFANMEMDVVLRMVLQHFTIRTTSAPGEKWHHRGVAFTPKKGGRVVLYRRATPLG